MPSKYGGIPVDEQPRSKFGGIPVEDTPSAPVMPKPGLPERKPDAIEQMKDAASGFGQGLVNDTFSGMWKAARHPIDTLSSIPATSRSFADTAASDFNKGNYVDAAQHALGMIPIVGPMGSNAIDAMFPPDGKDFNPKEAGRALGNIAAFKAVPEATGVLGKALRKGAEPVMESGLGIRAPQRKYGATPGRAALDMTTGVRPDSVAESAAQQISRQAASRDTAIGNSNAQASLKPGIDALNGAMKNAAAGNSETSHLAPMMEQLTEPRPGFAGNVAPTHQPAPGTAGPAGPLKISELQDPSMLLKMRQRFGNDFTKFDQARPLSSEALKVGNKTYGALTDELHRAVPESAPFDKNIQNLIPVKQSAEARALNAGAEQRILHRVAAHTGALTGATAGYHEFGPAGAIAGLVIPELLGSPTGQIATARMANSAGNFARRAKGATAALPVLGRDH